MGLERLILTELSVTTWQNFHITFIPGINSLKQNQPPFRIFKQRQFSIDDFHYLNVTRIGIFTSYDEWDCAFKCVRNTLCRSINMAASKGADGKPWCELLSSDKYRDAENYHENMTSHHFHVIVRTFFFNCREVKFVLKKAFID